MRDVVPLIDINHPRCGLNEFLEKIHENNKLLSMSRQQRAIFSNILCLFVDRKHVFSLFQRVTDNEPRNKRNP